MDIRAKIGIVNENESQFIGPGLIQLLDGIRVHKSINKAANAMGLSYKKAHRMLKRLEADLKEQVLVRRRGGTERGGTDITALGEVYIAEFKRLEDRVKKSAVEEFRVFEKRLLKEKTKKK